MNAKNVKRIFWGKRWVSCVGVSTRPKRNGKAERNGKQKTERVCAAWQNFFVLAINRFSFRFNGISRDTNVKNKEISELHEPNFGVTWWEKNFHNQNWSNHIALQFAFGLHKFWFFFFSTENVIELNVQRVLLVFGWALIISSFFDARFPRQLSSRLEHIRILLIPSTHQREEICVE